MTWLDEPGFERRPLVFVEDHLYHTGELVALLYQQRSDLIRQTTVVSLDRGGPDTEAAVGELLQRYRGLQVVASASPAAEVLLRPLARADTAEHGTFARLVASVLRPGGLLIQDVQLTTLPFLSPERWWESIYLAATVRGTFPTRPPLVRFLSNKRGYSATFGRDLVEAGFDPRDVMDKSSLAETVVPAIASLFDRAFPLELCALVAAASPRTWPVSEHEDERQDLARTLDLVLWPAAQGSDLGGRLVSSPDRRVGFRSGSPEAETWTRLLQDRLQLGDGLQVVVVGARLGPPGAERAELTNIAARHIHTLRGRLTDSSAIATVNHAYRLRDGLRVGMVGPR